MYRIQFKLSICVNRVLALGKNRMTVCGICLHMQCLSESGHQYLAAWISVKYDKF